MLCPEAETEPGLLPADRPRGRCDSSTWPATVRRKLGTKFHCYLVSPRGNLPQARQGKTQPAILRQRTGAPTLHPAWAIMTSLNHLGQPSFPLSQLPLQLEQNMTQRQLMRQQKSTGGFWETLSFLMKRAEASGTPSLHHSSCSESREESP